RGQHGQRERQKSRANEHEEVRLLRQRVNGGSGVALAILTEKRGSMQDLRIKNRADLSPRGLHGIDISHAALRGSVFDCRIDCSNSFTASTANGIAAPVQSLMFATYPAFTPACVTCASSAPV